MQMYKGLPIITNKISEAEQNGIPHHLFDFIHLKDKPWTVQHFVKESSRTINEIRKRGKLPIVVGGTIYYTFSLLFNDAILSPAGEGSLDSPGHAQAGNLERDFPVLSASTEEMLARLQDVDPEMARRWHPNDRLKIRNSLHIYLKTGRKASDIYAEQRRASRDHVDGEVIDDSSARPLTTVFERPASLRFRSLLLWLEGEDAVLKQRLNNRVDAMIAYGLCDEVLQMASLERELMNDGDPVGLTHGIWASIGYKEMKPWLEAQQAPDTDGVRTAKTKHECIEAVKASTRRYAKRQNRFVRIRLAKALKAAGTPDMLFLLDCTDLTRWSPAVGQPAEALVRAFLEGDELPEARTLSAMADATLTHIEEDSTVTTREARACEVCHKILMTEKEWTGHLAGRSHKKLVASLRKQQALPDKNTEQGQSVQLLTPPG